MAFVAKVVLLMLHLFSLEQIVLSDSITEIGQAKSLPLIAYTEKLAKGHNEHESNPYSDTKLISTEHHENNEESSSSNKGDAVKENHNRETEEKGEKHNTSEDEDNDSGHYEVTAKKQYDSKYKGADSQKKRKSEKGFYNSYHKNEYHKLDNFFGNHHAGGEYLTFGQANEKRISNSAKSGKGSAKTATGSDGAKKSGKKQYKNSANKKENLIVVNKDVDLFGSVPLDKQSSRRYDAGSGNAEQLIDVKHSAYVYVKNTTI